MIIAFANLSGNSGKTTISASLAVIKGLPLIRIESMNSTFSSADIQIESKNSIIDAIGTIHSFKDIGQSVIVDIGSSDLGHIFSEINTEYNALKASRYTHLFSFLKQQLRLFFRRWPSLANQLFEHE